MAPMANTLPVQSRAGVQKGKDRGRYTRAATSTTGEQTSPAAGTNATWNLSSIWKYPGFNLKNTKIMLTSWAFESKSVTSW